MSLLLTYLLILLGVFLLQRKMMYFPAHYSKEQQQDMLEELRLQAWPSIGELRGLISRPQPADAKGTILIFHGNAGSAIHRSYYFDALQPLGYRVIIAEYPGYGARSGSPTEATLIKDGIETAKAVLQEFKEPLFLCGESLGSGVVAGIVVSHQVPVKGLLLITPFDAMTKVAQHHYWFFLPKWLLLDKFENTEKLRGFSGPIAIILADQDEVIPNRRTLSLFDALSPGKKLWRFDHASHNTLPLEPWRPWWQEAMLFIDH